MARKSAGARRVAQTHAEGNPMAVDPVSGNTPQISGAIRQAAQSTGVSFEYLLTTARIESNLNPTAQASTSSAKGLYQRILNVVANPRPVIKTKTYFGPDRRRNTNNAYIGPERRVGGEMEVLQQPSLLDKARSNI